MVRGLDGFCDTRCVVFKGPRGARFFEAFRWLWRGGYTSSLSEQSS